MSNRNFKSTDASNYGRKVKRDTLIKYLPLLIDPEHNEIDMEILKTIENTPFNRIQIPLFCSRYITEDGDSNRFVTIGTILDYNVDKRHFKVLVHKQFKDIVDAKLADCEDGEMYAAIQYMTFKNSFSSISKIHLNIIDYALNDAADEESATDDASVEE